MEQLKKMKTMKFTLDPLKTSRNMEQVFKFSMTSFILKGTFKRATLRVMVLLWESPQPIKGSLNTELFMVSAENL